MVRGGVHGDRRNAIVPNEATAQEGGPPGRLREGNEAQKKNLNVRNPAKGRRRSPARRQRALDGQGKGAKKGHAKSPISADLA